MKFIKKNLNKIISLVFYILLPLVSFAQIEIRPCDTSGKICNPLTDVDSLDGLVLKLLTGLIKIGIPIIALAIVYCGFLFVAARGNSEKLSKAKDALLYTLIGAAILLGSWAIAQVISETVTGLSA